MTPTSAGKQWWGFLMLNYVWIMLGDALGTASRFWALRLIAPRVGEFFPFGAPSVNVTGSFIIGFFAIFTDPALET